ncbi:MAG TPA: ABC transporter permease [Jatrophihabitantaceae bacterium]|jgi:peptide/nickel transport system permease protein|nr:ABC transporter permease [Jatrophihabitantaceae bacterium]
MVLYLVKRLVVGVVVILLVATAVFFITRVISNPALAFLPIDASREQRDDVLHYLGLDQSLRSQYWHFLVQLAHLNLGTSFWQQGKPAADIVFARLPDTLILDGVAIALSVAIAVPLGVVAALRPGSKLDRGTTTVSLLGLSIPEFWLGFMLVLIFGVKLHWFPTSGAHGASSIVLPALSLALPTSGKIAQMMRSSMIDELDQPYMLTAESKGMTTAYRITRHALRNCLVPVFTQSSFEFARMLAGYTVVVEVVFAWPGVGQLIVQALQNQDLVLLQAIVIILAALIVLVNVITDVLYNVIDPRIEVA